MNIFFALLFPSFLHDVRYAWYFGQSEYIKKMDGLKYNEYVEEVSKAPTLDEIFARYAGK